MAEQRSKNVDPTWPELSAGEHVISEFNSDRQGASSPFGELEFPLDPQSLPYTHPTTVINR